MYHTTGFSRDAIIDLCAMVSATEPEPGINHWPPILGLFKSVTVTLTYLRRNHVQAELAEYFRVSQSTISRAIAGLTPVVARMLADQVPVAEDLDHGAQYIIDGTLLPCWSWHAHPELYSGKHKTTGMNIQVVCDLYGTLQWVSDPVNGNRHDSAALEISGRAGRTRPRRLDRRQGLHRKRNADAHQETTVPRPSRLGKGIQQAGQQDPLPNRAGHR
jgi:hypothetical protein